MLEKCYWSGNSTLCVFARNRPAKVPNNCKDEQRTKRINKDCDHMKEMQLQARIEPKIWTSSAAQQPANSVPPTPPRPSAPARTGGELRASPPRRAGPFRRVINPRFRCCSKSCCGEKNYRPFLLLFRPRRACKYQMPVPMLLLRKPIQQS